MLCFICVECPKWAIMLGVVILSVNMLNIVAPEGRLHTYGFRVRISNTLFIVTYKWANELEFLLLAVSSS
jgi:hypothetical protein